MVRTARLACRPAGPRLRARRLHSLCHAQTEDYVELDREDNKTVKMKVVKMFESMDIDKDGKLILSEAESFFKSFKTLTAKAMFNEVRRGWRRSHVELALLAAPQTGGAHASS
jgi:hypothetical protein